MWKLKEGNFQKLMYENIMTLGKNFLNKKH